MATHNFITSNSVGGIGEAILFSVLSRLGPVDSVVKDREWQKIGVDFILENVWYDSKLDTKAFSTGNLALETVSKKKDGQVLKRGWVYTSKADCIAYIFLEGLAWSIYFFSTDEMLELIKSESYKVKSIKNFGYESEVILVPIEDLSHKKKMSVPVVGEADLGVLKTVHGYFKENKE